jgi:hypothetical protein
MIMLEETGLGGSTSMSIFRWVSSFNSTPEAQSNNKIPAIIDTDGPDAGLT